jgi:YD repeat-containing protein
MGQVIRSNEQNIGQTYHFSYVYNLADALTSETYPSERTVTTVYDGANRPYSVNGTLPGAQTNYVTQTNYWPHDARTGNGFATVWFPSLTTTRN